MVRKRAKTFADILNPAPSRWPAAGDRLFVAATDADGGATIAKHPFERLVFMTKGYREAANSLVNEALADRVRRYSLIYPIIFCYRQFIELSLKALIGSYGPQVGIPRPGNIHDLKKLLKSYRKMLCEYHINDPLRADINVSKCILEFDRLDASSFTFRYATGNDGQPYPIAVEAINLQRLRDTMEGVGNYFEGTDSYLCDLVSAIPTDS
jgi:hypothetical protein